MPRTGRWSLLVVMFLAVTSDGGRASAQEIVMLPDGESATVQAALDAAHGNTKLLAIVVPDGHWNWGAEKVSVADIHDVVLIGAGASHSRFYRDESCRGGPMLQVERSSNVRISGLTFDGCDDLAEYTGTGWTQPQGVQLVDVDDLRVDHCLFRDLGRNGVRSNGEDAGGCRGVVDHCDFIRMFDDAVGDRGNLGYGVVVSGTGVIDGVPFGSADATFVEDCFFDRTRHAGASSGGARYVFRHNEVIRNRNSHAVDAHGHSGSAAVGTEWVEIYSNLIHEPVNTTAAVRIRGGKGIVWNNGIRGYVYAVSLWERTDQQTGPVYIWGNDLGSGVRLLGDVSEDPVARYSRPSGYEPYTYPHPLVTDLTLRTGRDRNVTVGDDGTASVYVDATRSTADSGSIVAYRWYDGETLLSTCAQDILNLLPGRRVLVLTAESGAAL